MTLHDLVTEIAMWIYRLIARKRRGTTPSYLSCRTSSLDHLMRTDEYAWTLLAWWLCGFVTYLKRFPSSGDRIASMRATPMVQPGPAILSQPGNLSPNTAQGSAPRLTKWRG